QGVLEGPLDRRVVQRRRLERRLAPLVLVDLRVRRQQQPVAGRLRQRLVELALGREERLPIVGERRLHGRELPLERLRVVGGRALGRERRDLARERLAKLVELPPLDLGHRQRQGRRLEGPGG